MRDLRGELAALIGDEVALQAWLAVLRDPDRSVRSEALNALSGLCPASAAAALIDVVRADPVDFVRAHAALVLGECAPASSAALEVLLAMLRDAAEPAHIRGAVAEALHRYDDPRVLPALVAALEDPEPEVRYYTAFALSACANPAALPALERAAAREQAMLPPPLGSVRDELQTAIEHIEYVAGRRAGTPGPPA
jgi:HEAT repeat protein